MNIPTKIICMFILLISSYIRVGAEGTKTIMPFAAAQGAVEINKFRSDFGFYDAAPEYRINISISSTQEHIRFGFGEVFGDSWFSYPGDMVYRIKDPSGTIVYGPAMIPVSGTGYIDSYDKAVAGPFAGGYPYLEMTPNTTGDFYIEFYYPPGSNYSEENQHSFRYFDMTVIDASGNAVNGRVWSEAWQFWCLGVEDPPSDHRFYGTMSILSSDSIVTEVNINGVIGGAFAISSNATGCVNTGNMVSDRQSLQGSHTYPEYKIFLNDPDSLLYPTSKVNTGVILPVMITPDCATGGVDIGIRVVKDGIVEILIELNPAPGADPEDVKLEAKVRANPGGAGYNVIHWNGNDNNGNPVPNGTAVLATITCLNGLTNIPLNDIEYNDNGFIVSQVRPKGEQIRIFWDDSRIPGGTVDTITGCITGSGCHTWDYLIGDMNTINSWWYVKRNDIPSIPFTVKRLPGNPGQISGPPGFCNFTGTAQYSIRKLRDAESYTWTYTGPGVTITGSDTVANLTFSLPGTSGTLTVVGHNAACGDGPPSTLVIYNDTTPVVTLSVSPEICQSMPEFQFSGGTPPGGEYTFDGTISETFNAGIDSLGPHIIIYTFTSPGGCANSDTAAVEVKDCPEIDVFFPTAFTPDGDGLNDLFRPAGTTFLNFSLSIFDRYGQMIFTTEDPTSGWDGKVNGSLCPAGVYPWVSVFEVPEQNHAKRKAHGTVMLLR